MEPTPQRHLTQLPGLSRARRRPRTEAKADPEIALRINPDGSLEEVPLTLDILLNPSEDVHVPQNDVHSGDIYILTQRLKRFVERRGGWRLFSDLIIDWPGERDVSPDISIAKGLKDLDKERGTLDVVKEGCEVVAVIEVVTPTSGMQREKDEDINPPLFARVGVKDCVLVYPAELRTKEDPPIRVYSLVRGAYAPRKPDSQGRFLLRSLGVRLSVRMRSGVEELIVEDAKTGDLLTTVDEEEEKRKAEEGKRKAEAAKRRAEAARRRKAERKAEAEASARQEAESVAAQMLLSILENRNLEIDDAVRQRILDCHDASVLRGWLDRAWTVDRPGELFI